MCSITNSNFKRPYLGNEKSNFRSAGAKILVWSRAFTYSFMKVASRHSFTLFRPLSGRKTTFSGCSRCGSLVRICPRACFPCRKKKNLLHLLKEKRCSKICELFRGGVFLGGQMSIIDYEHRLWSALATAVQLCRANKSREKAGVFVEQYSLCHSS